MPDFKINPALCFRPEDLTNFMKQNTLDNSLTQEIAAALIYRMVFEKEFGWKDYYIYFEPKQSKDKELLETIGSTIRMVDFVSFISENAEQATINDVIFVHRNEGDEADVRPVQIKRFGKGLPKGNLTQTFINYLQNKIVKKYPKSKATLLVHLETSGSIDYQPVVDWLNSNNFNFEELVMFAVQPDMSALVVQFLPNSGQAGFVQATRNEIYMN